MPRSKGAAIEVAASFAFFLHSLSDCEGGKARHDNMHALRWGDVTDTAKGAMTEEREGEVKKAHADFNEYMSTVGTPLLAERKSSASLFLSQRPFPRLWRRTLFVIVTAETRLSRDAHQPRGLLENKMEGRER